MAGSSFPIGALLELAIAFTDIRDPDNPVAADPTTITLQIGTPAGVNTTYTYGVGQTIQKTATGSYYAEIEATEAGTWRWYWRGTGAVKAGRAGTYEITGSGF
jgi:hypothetical protein